MLECFSFFSSQSYSYLFNCHVQNKMYNWLDTNTEETQCLMLPGIGMWTASSLITLATRVAGVAEVFLKGSGYLLASPFTNNKALNAKIGLNEIFVHTPKNILRIACSPLDFLGGTIDIFIGPKSFTMRRVEYTRVNLLHTRAGTLHSKEHNDDLSEVEGIVKPKFMDYQRRTMRRLHPERYKDKQDDS